jgi:hypothetical protein
VRKATDIETSRWIFLPHLLVVEVDQLGFDEESRSAAPGSPIQS